MQRKLRPYLRLNLSGVEVLEEQLEAGLPVVGRPPQLGEPKAPEDGLRGNEGTRDRKPESTCRYLDSHIESST